MGRNAWRCRRRRRVRVAGACEHSCRLGMVAVYRQARMRRLGCMRPRRAVLVCLSVLLRRLRKAQPRLPRRAAELELGARVAGAGYFLRTVGPPRPGRYSARRPVVAPLAPPGPPCRRAGGPRRAVLPVARADGGSPGLGMGLQPCTGIDDRVRLCVPAGGDDALLGATPEDPSPPLDDADIDGTLGHARRGHMLVWAGVAAEERHAASDAHGGPRLVARGKPDTLRGSCGGRGAFGDTLCGRRYLCLGARAAGACGLQGRLRAAGGIADGHRGHFEWHISLHRPQDAGHMVAPQ
mmetsp:Transcript_42226/g.107441  ORF Transcript_42226/g.107441 Transcript_42226/m.107441 type:complete len:295 (-) Transcript_42226:181-1065(-)